MQSTLPVLLVSFGLLAPQIVRPAQASGFTAFTEDEEVCRRVGTAAIGDAVGPAAARRYDFATQRCMFAHIRRRQMGAAHPPEPPAASNTVGFPDAYFAIPYATPGYGYDGFSPYQP